MVQGLGFMIKRLGLKAYDLGFGSYGLEFSVRGWVKGLGFGLGVKGSWFTL
jgi:hypothetical protein